MYIPIKRETQKKIILQILENVAMFCEKEGLQYYLAYGTLIGAIRHSGFIPWDDDIDIWMPRQDYEIFIQKYPLNNKKYKLVHYTNDSHFDSFFVEVVDTTTVLQTEDGAYKLGLFIDVFPLDNAGNDKSIVDKFLMTKLSFWQKMGYIKVLDSPKPIKKIVKFLLNIVPKKMIFSKIDILSSSFCKDKESKYVANLVLCRYGKKEVLNREWFGKGQEILFEGKTFRIPCNYDNVLRNLYGDYMQLPPIEDQNYPHSYDAFYKVD